MKKYLSLLCIAVCALCINTNAQKRITFEEYDFTGGAIFQSVSDNGKYVAGYSSASYGGANTGFVYLVEEDTLICLNPKYEENDKNTYVKLLGLEKSKELVEQYSIKAKEALDVFGDRAEFLRKLADYLINRTN